MFFYGTGNVAHLKALHIWPYTPDNKAKFVIKNLKRKGYFEALKQMEQEPGVARVEGRTFTEDQHILNEVRMKITKTTRSGREVKMPSSGYNQDCVMNAYTHKKRQKERKDAMLKEHAATFRKKNKKSKVKKEKKKSKVNNEKKKVKKDKKKIETEIV